MDQSIKVDFRAFRKEHIAGRPREEKLIPSISPKRGAEADALGKAVSVAGGSSSKVPVIGKPLDLAARKTRITWLPSPDEIAQGNAGTFTLAAGIGGSGGVYAAPLAGCGIYGSDSGEIGVYGSVGIMAMTNAGFSGGLQGTVMRGAPSVYFAGQALGFGVDVGIPGKVISVGGVIYFDLALYLKRKLYICGAGWNVSAGLSFLPATVSMQYSYTALKPMLLIS
jgi:hypothetical protein